jgi:hypothetical protein
MKSTYKRFAVIGVGGFSCPCCAPKSGNKYGARARVILKRQAKRKEVVGLIKFNKGE